MSRLRQGGMIVLILTLGGMGCSAPRPALSANGQAQRAKPRRGDYKIPEERSAIRLLPARLIPAGAPWSDSNYHSMILASDGNLYWSLHTHQIDRYARIHRYRPGADRAERFVDVGELEGVAVGDAWLTQGKIHTPIFEANGKLYFATMKSWYKEDTRGRAYPGGYFCEVDLKTGKGRALAKTPEGEGGVISMAMDPGRGRLYGLTWKGGLLLDCDVKTGEVKNLGPQFDRGEYGEKGVDWHRINREILIGPGGLVYSSRLDGKIFEYDPDTGKVRHLSSTLRTRDGDVTMWRSGVYDPVRRRLFVVHQSSSALLSVDPRKDEVRQIGEMAVPIIRNRRPNPFFSQLGIQLEGNRITYSAHGPAIEVAGVPLDRQRQQAYLLTYDLETNRLTDHGAIVVMDPRSGLRRAFYTESVAVDRKGGVYISASLEVKDPERVKMIEKARNGATPFELAWSTYEMQLLYVPPELLRTAGGP